MDYGYKFVKICCICCKLLKSELSIKVGIRMTILIFKNYQGNKEKLEKKYKYNTKKLLNSNNIIIPENDRFPLILPGRVFSENAEYCLECLSSSEKAL